MKRLFLALVGLAVAFTAAACSGGLPSNGTVQGNYDKWVLGASGDATGNFDVGAVAAAGKFQYTPNSAGPGSAGDGGEGGAGGKAVLSGECEGVGVDTRSALILSEGDGGVSAAEQKAGIELSGSMSTGHAARLIAQGIRNAASDGDDAKLAPC